MTQNSSQTQIVQTMYAAFGRGDIAGILSHLTEDVDWSLNVDPAAPGAKAVPDFRPFRGRADVQTFFQLIGADLEFHGFEPQAFFIGENEVAARVRMDMTIRKTGRRLKLESMHVFTFDATGKIRKFREYLDTLAVAAAWGTVQEKR
jgi:uncharacterized protein